MQTISLTAIAGKLANAFAASTAIASYCVAAYSSGPHIFVGINGKNPPTENDCPYILVLPNQKTEGPQLEEHIYSLTIGWGIKDDTTTVTTATATAVTITTLDALTAADAIGQLLYAACESAGAYPPSQISYQLEGIEFYPQVVGRMELEIRVTPCMGGSLAY